ncbi:hypothetical protein Taro_012222 [Colocasia esculenta]|uniref:Uncharacterized protein n=1 Tax=Colocasia esculenta TaxID=4460 RepID=A0A843U8G4_COLES|nr:hypothetical protein [Colocasia esculenta]
MYQNKSIKIKKSTKNKHLWTTPKMPVDSPAQTDLIGYWQRYLSTAPLMPVDRSAQTEPTSSWQRCYSCCRQTKRKSQYEISIRFRVKQPPHKNPSKVSREKIFLPLYFNRSSRQPKRHPLNGIEARLSISQASPSTDTCQDDALKHIGTII